VLQIHTTIDLLLLETATRLMEPLLFQSMATLHRFLLIDLHILRTADLFLLLSAHLEEILTQIATALHLPVALL